MLPLKAIVLLCSTLQASAWSLGGARACVAGCTSPITAHSAPRAHHTALMQAEPAPMEIKSDETYGLMLKTLMATEENVADQISANYAMVDYNFLQQLDGRLAEGKAEEAGKTEEAKKEEVLRPWGLSRTGAGRFQACGSLRTALTLLGRA